ncbi:hypothetical protein FXV83_16290 [Bradyrhizobium hipponense]|uniref:Uncharacterized protein n=1 Tax=Bradyrhizobium hipponense TaxID=2605638 RepID=A0A5S4YPA5_9BRAD|nr:hypothetical protein [Bradyrhizobium hipponense]TYO65494.1 hypothetical protein FXV83_16290 [Bradyrhizobium hipponense]
MSHLHRKPDKDPHRAGGWFVYWGDVRVGHIAKRAGIPNHTPQWGWSCGFYPGCEPGQSTTGTAESFEEARAGFERDWEKLLATRTEEHFEEWRRSRDFHAWKDKMHEEKLFLPTQTRGAPARCFCGEFITIASQDEHIHCAHRGIGA